MLAVRNVRTQVKIAGIALLALVIGLAASQRSQPPAAKSESRSATTARPQAPQFSLVDLDGHPLHLADYRGKVILLDFWATWCVPCETEIPRFIAWQDKYGPQGFQVIGLSMDDDAQPVRAFSRKFRMNYPVAMANEKVAEAYGGILGLPANFVIDRDGRIYAKHVGTTDLPTLEREITKRLAAR